MSQQHNILIVNSSARETRSLTRELTKLFQESFTEKGNAHFRSRDVGVSPPSFINEKWIAAAFTPTEELTNEQSELLAESDALIQEVKDADIIVLGVPMYNYSMPASLKAWFDLVARVDQTFSFDLAHGDYPIQPILKDKKLVILSSRGEFGFRNGGIRAHKNGLDTALEACALYLGADAQNIETIAIEYEEFKDKRWETSVDDALKSTIALANRLAA